MPRFPRPAGLAALLLSAACPLIVASAVCPAAAPSQSDPAALEVYDPQGQWQRARRFICRFAEKRLDWFDRKGRWIGPGRAPWRSLEQSAYVAPFLELGSRRAVALANAIIENQPVHTLDMAHALVFYRDKLTPAAVSRMEKLVAADVTGRYQQFRWKHFQGDNDNFQLHAAATVALWGVYTGKQQYLDDARARLEEFKALLTRRGFASEYNSPAYLPLHLHPLAQIVEAVKDPALKKLAYDLEARTWLDLLCHYHQPSATQAGPWSRQYNFNIYGSGFSAHNLYLLLGDRLPIDWQEGFQAESVEFGLVRAANRSCVRYHCPTWLVQWALARRYPFSVIGSAEGSASFKQLEPDRHGNLFHWNWKETADKDDDLYTLPAWHSRIVQYQTADYALGTTTRPFNNSWQNYTFVVTCPARRPLQSTDDIVRIMARYIVDEHQPGVTWQAGKASYADEQVAFAEAGRSICLQHEKTALVLYRPDPIVNHQPTSLKTMIHWPKTNFGRGRPRGLVYLGARKVEHYPAESAQPVPVFVQIGRTYLAFIPLLNHQAVGVELASKAAVRVGPEGKTLGISFYNYQGPPLALNRRQYCLIGNGFVCEMGSASEDGSFEQFRTRFASGKYEVTDLYRRTVHSRGAYSRLVIYRRPGLTLETEYNPTSEGIRYQAINGKVPPSPQLQATGLPYDKVPFLQP